jgi:hypothetical protein
MHRRLLALSVACVAAMLTACTGSGNQGVPAYLYLPVACGAQQPRPDLASIGAGVRGQAAGRYSLIRPPRTCFRSTTPSGRSPADVARAGHASGGRCLRERCGR